MQLRSRRSSRHAALNAQLPIYFGSRGAGVKTAAGGTTVGRAVMLKALGMLNDKLAEAESPQTLWMIGGGAIMLHLDGRDSSGDLDVIPRKGDFRALMGFAEEVAHEMRQAGTPIPEDWINGDFTPQFMTMGIGASGFVEDSRYRWSHLSIKFARPELLLAMKCFSFRPEGNDHGDIAFLIKKIPVRNLDHLYDIIETYGDLDMIAGGEEDGDVLLESLAKKVLGGWPY